MRPSWLAAIAVGPGVTALLVPAALVLGTSVLGAVVNGVFFGLVYVVLDHRRWVELTPTAATANQLWRSRSIARSEVRGVARDRWWNGGLRLSTSGKDFRLPVGDRSFGRVSDERLAVVTNWMATDEPSE